MAFTVGDSPVSATYTPDSIGLGTVDIGDTYVSDTYDSGNEFDEGLYGFLLDEDGSFILNEDGSKIVLEGEVNLQVVGGVISSAMYVVGDMV